jgi:hypothetical protein
MNIVFFLYRLIFSKDVNLVLMVYNVKIKHQHQTRVIVSNSFFYVKNFTKFIYAYIFLVGAILGGIFGALAAIALVIVGYIYVLPKIRGARFELNI